MIAGNSFRLLSIRGTFLLVGGQFYHSYGQRAPEIISVATVKKCESMIVVIEERKID